MRPFIFRLFSSTKAILIESFAATAVRTNLTLQMWIAKPRYERIEIRKVCELLAFSSQHTPKEAL
jgi:hypothetical protein